MATKAIHTALISGLAFGACLLGAAGETDPRILTPAPGAAPKINGASVYGARPGRPFLYRIPCTGRRPMKFSAKGLPASLRLEPDTGIIRGNSPDKAATYEVTLKATNAAGTATRRFRIVVGDLLALTPPMGWNDWYTHYDRITDKLMREAADAMISSGMADYGYQYVNIDDCWMMKPGSDDPHARTGRRGTTRGPSAPTSRFPDMKALTDYIHAKGLKAGIYTSPGPLTCARFAGSYQHEESGRAHVRRMGLRFPEVRLVLVPQDRARQDSSRIIRSPTS